MPDPRLDGCPALHGGAETFRVPLQGSNRSDPSGWIVMADIDVALDYADPLGGSP